MNEKRYLAQINKLKDIFADFTPFLTPLDQNLSQLYRANKSFGSKDRKFISGALFGFNRWFGWLQKLDVSDEHRLLLGFLLDSNEINPMVVYWAEKLGYDLQFLHTCECPDVFDLTKKLEFIQGLNPDLTLQDLNPDFADEQPTEFFEFTQKRAPLWLRCQTANMDKVIQEFNTKEIPFKRHPKLENTLEVLTTPNLPGIESFRKGFFQVQDISSQMVGEVMPIQKHDKWLDLCAGAGGKTLHLAEKLAGSGRVFGLDIREGSVNEGIKRVKKSKLRNIGFQVWDGEILPPFGEKFAGVLVDAPCSGSGTWRRAPDLRWRTSLEDVKKYSMLQSELLQKGADQVKEGGVVGYVTCSIFPQENAEVVDAFLEKNQNFALKPFAHPVTGEELSGSHLFNPQDLDGVAIFITLMQRQ